MGIIVFFLFYFSFQVEHTWSALLLSQSEGSLAQMQY